MGNLIHGKRKQVLLCNKWDWFCLHNHSNDKKGEKTSSSAPSSLQSALQPSIMHHISCLHVRQLQLITLFLSQLFIWDLQCPPSLTSSLQWEKGLTLPLSPSLSFIIYINYFILIGSSRALFSSHPKNTIKRGKSRKCKFTFETLQQFFRENGEKKCICTVLAAKNWVKWWLFEEKNGTFRTAK